MWSALAPRMRRRARRLSQMTIGLVHLHPPKVIEERSNDQLLGRSTSLDMWRSRVEILLAVYKNAAKCAIYPCAPAISTRVCTCDPYFFISSLHTTSCPLAKLPLYSRLVEMSAVHRDKSTFYHPPDISCLDHGSTL